MRLSGASNSGRERTVIGAVAATGAGAEIEALRAAPGLSADRIALRSNCVYRQLRQRCTVVEVWPESSDRWRTDLTVIAGPCSG